MAYSRTKPPWHSLGSALAWTFGGLIFVWLGLVEGSSAGTYAFGIGLLMLALGSISLVGLYGTDLVVECRDLKERAFGERRSKYEP
ncbi:hypothetical protein [Halorubellus litoreus]|uniref:YiaAB two helix domain-containing protein n=1 Tax=Halorubellus litoreus TaxID=755308 RepID=A0ABD5VGG9_9EURY